MWRKITVIIKITSFSDLEANRRYNSHSTPSLLCHLMHMRSESISFFYYYSATLLAMVDRGDKAAQCPIKSSLCQLSSDVMILGYLPLLASGYVIQQHS